MGGKSSKTKLTKKAFHPQEEERVLSYFGLENTNTNLSAANLKENWEKLLVKSLCKNLIDHLRKLSSTNGNGFISMDALALVYVTFVRGTLDEIAALIADLIGSTTNANNEVVVSYNDVIKYIEDLISSYLMILENSKDKCFMSWSAGSRKIKKTLLVKLVTAWCTELPHENNEVFLYNLELWLSLTGMVTLIHNLVIASLYNLNDNKTILIPRAILPMPKVTSILDASQIMYLNSVLPSEYRTQWRFLFSTRTHGESFSKMIGSIANEGPTLIVIEDSKSHTFGGFASDSWLPGPKFIGNDTCFLFTLTPEVKIFPSTGYNNHYMYANCNQTSLPNGLGMGGQFGYWGLWLDYHFGLGECSESCTTFRNYTMLSGAKKFNMVHLEIWGVGDPPLTAEERGERASVLDKDPTVTQMLEMIGRKQHSKGLRESPGRVKPMFPKEEEGNSGDDE